MSGLVATHSVPSQAQPPIFTANWTRASTVLRRRFDEIAAFGTLSKPRQGATLNEIVECLPITDKLFYQYSGENAFLEPARSVLLLSETSGTSGSMPLLTPRGRSDFTWNTFNQSIAYAENVKPGFDRVILLNPSVMSPFIEASSKALFDLGVTHLRAYPIPKICDYRRLGRLINDYQITAIMSTPSLMFKLLYELQKEAIPVPSLTTLMLTGEHISRSTLAGLDRVLGVKGASRPLVYGSSESASVMRGRIDGDYLGYLEDFMFEIAPVDEPWASELAVSLPPDAITGRLLVTWLRDGIMPMVRYDTQDIFSCWTDTATGETIFRSQGRADGRILSPVQLDCIEELLFSSLIFDSDPVVHYDFGFDDDLCLLSVITLHGKDLKISAEIEEILRRRIGKSIFVDINPRSHAFYDFSPRPKTQRIEDLRSRRK